MHLFRFLSILTLGLFFATDVIGQVYQSQPQPASTNSVQQPIRQIPLQTPPKTVTQNGVPVYQQGQKPPAGMADRTMPPGYGSPYPTNLPIPNGEIKVAQASTTGSIYGLPPQNDQSAARQPIPVITNLNNPVPFSATLPPVPGTVREQIHEANEKIRSFIGHSEPVSRIVPFFLTPQEQQELDEFLVLWEKYSLGIKRYEADFTMYCNDETIPGTVPGKPYRTAFGSFKFNAKPLRFVYHVEGEWVGGKKVEQDNDKNPQIFAEKIIIDEKAVYKYEFNAKTVLQINVPPELIGKGIADSPLPLIFGAKAEDLKKRFSMKMVTDEQHKKSEIWLQARPLLIEDQQEFSQIEVRLDKVTLRATSLKKEDINGKAYTVYVLPLQSTTINPVDILGGIREKFFTPTVPKGWKHEINDWVLDIQMAKQQPATAIPGAAPVTPQPVIGNNQPQRNEIPLYLPK